MGKISPVNGKHQLSENGKLLAQVFSNAFKVHDVVEFPGVPCIYMLMVGSTALTKSFSRQGLKIPIKNAVGLPGDEAEDSH